MSLPRASDSYSVTLLPAPRWNQLKMKRGAGSSAESFSVLKSLKQNKSEWNVWCTLRNSANSARSHQWYTIYIIPLRQIRAPILPIFKLLYTLSRTILIYGKIGMAAIVIVRYLGWNTNYSSNFQCKVAIIHITNIQSTQYKIYYSVAKV